MIVKVLNTVEDVQEILSAHEMYRSRCLNLIASENLPSPTVKKFLTCDLGGRYPTYYDDPAKRNYMGTKYLAEMEIATQELAKRVYRSEFVDFRPLGGHLAGVGVICALTRPGDTVFETSDFGGHMTATKLVSAGLLEGLLNVEYIPFDPDEHMVDMPVLKQLAREKKPKLIIFGRDQILFPEQIEPIRETADELGIYIAYDMSHVHGLIVGKAFPNPLDQGADVLLGSHHKTIPGPQGGLYTTRRQEMYTTIRRGIYPTFVTNHHVERIPALAVMYLEMIEFGEAYAAQIVKNSQALGKALFTRGISALYPHKGFSRSHQVLVDVSNLGSGGDVAAQLEQAGIICGKTLAPHDVKSGRQTSSGLRVGTQEVTRQGMLEEDMSTIAGFFQRVLVEKEPGARVAADIADFVSQRRALKFCYDEGVDPFNEMWKKL